MVEFLINNKICFFDIKNDFSYGKIERLSIEGVDLTYNQPWYNEGYTVENFLNESEFHILKSGIADCLYKIVGKKFDIDKYHNFCNNRHYEIVSKTRDLFPEDFNFDIKKFVKKLGDILNLKLTDIDPDSGKKLHIIIRINRPLSTDYNPPHKDIYQQYDETGVIPKCINFWIPICGVNENSMLPLASGSHKIPENLILRSFNGGLMNDKSYNVRSVINWDGSNSMICPNIEYGQVLIFSSHLIHGCAVNKQHDMTRIALEFRLFVEK